jgi:hypothetical protein
MCRCTWIAQFKATDEDDIENTSTVFVAARMFTESLSSNDDIPLLL